MPFPSPLVSMKQQGCRCPSCTAMSLDWKWRPPDGMAFRGGFG